MRFRAAIVSVAAGVAVLALAVALRSRVPHASRTEAPPSVVVSPSAPPVASTVPSRMVAVDPGPPPADEASLMTRVRAVQDSDPALALALARDGNARFPGSPDAAERAEIVVKSLALLGRPSDARREAEAMVNRYPGTPWALDVERHTGAHPHVLP